MRTLFSGSDSMKLRRSRTQETRGIADLDLSGYRTYPAKIEGSIFAAQWKNHAFSFERDRRDRSPIDRINVTNLVPSFVADNERRNKIGAQERTRTSTDCSTDT